LTHECRIRPTEEDLRVIEANRREDEKASDVTRRALRLLDREAWEERARADMQRLRTEDLSAEADAWEYDADTGELIDYLPRDDMTQVEHSLSRHFGLLR